ncbi:MAG: hypothetical protein HC796_07635 [Synechococcaceae cyanobacterium RL_1_2]|nr:hypothetical protein [Synechococcaceae cyanobacterium RL_1_2]
MGSGLAMTQAKSGPIKQSIQSIANQVINQQSLQNEIRVTWIKSIIFVVSCGLDLIIFVFPQPMIGEESVPITIFLISFTASIVSIGFLKALKHPMACQWLPTLQLAIALFDGFILGLFITNIAIVLAESNPQIITNIAALL